MSDDVLHLTTTENDEFTEREVLFTIDGAEYTVLKRVSAGAGLQYLRVSLMSGNDAARMFALTHDA